MRPAVNQAISHTKHVSFRQQGSTSDASETGEVVHHVPCAHHKLVCCNAIPASGATLYAKQPATMNDFKMKIIYSVYVLQAEAGQAVVKSQVHKMLSFV